MMNEMIMEYFSDINQMELLNRYMALCFIFHKGIVSPEELAEYFGYSLEELSKFEEFLIARNFPYYNEDIDLYVSEKAFDLYDVAFYLEFHRC